MHGAVPVMMYLYAPAVPVAGLNWPVGKGWFEGSSHEPLPPGEPPSALMRLTVAPVLQSVSVPLVPAFGAWFSTTVTVAESLGQGAVPVRTYVYTPAGRPGRAGL